MTAFNVEAMRERIKAIKQDVKRVTSGGRLDHSALQGPLQSALSVMTLIYGAQSHQVAEFLVWSKRGGGSNDLRSGSFEDRVADGIPVSWMQLWRTTSLDSPARSGYWQAEKCSALVALARSALAVRAPDTERVAAVLAAASLEETMKRLGELNGIDVYDRDFRGVIQKLQDAELLTGAQPRLASGFSTFRDHASHGQFDLIERGTIEAALAFVEGILSTRMS
jgi:hypothetical protein